MVPGIIATQGGFTCPDILYFSYNDHSYFVELKFTFIRMPKRLDLLPNRLGRFAFIAVIHSKPKIHISHIIGIFLAMTVD